MTRSLAAVALLISSACSGGGGATGDDAPPPGSDGGVDAAPDSGAPGGDDRPRGYDALSYTLRARFDWTTRRLFAVEDITLQIGAGVAPRIELDSKVQVTRVFAGAQALSWSADATAQTLHVDLAPLVATAGAPVTFSVEYEAPTSGALIATQGRADDPVRSRVVYSDSEPDRGVGWLVANHRPSDRARFAVELTVPTGEDVIANGERVRDEVQGGARVIGYAIEQPIPTYIMAFAAGELEHHDRAGRVPLSIWHRRGVLVDAETHLDILVAELAALEPLVGAYPWARYAVVLLPEFPAGGMENATVTFNSEPIGQGHISLATNAHELAHHWFGDWVTMRRFEDAWFKEGMATLLQWEADRAKEDLGDSGRLFGNYFSFNAYDAIVDPELSGTAKYTSGIYDRAAWMINQIRARLGEDVFWQALRNLLAAHALDSIDGETFVRGFAPALDEATIVQILGTLQRKEPPSLAVTVTPDGADRQVRLTLSDPAGAVIAPMTITLVDAAGEATEHVLATGVPLQLTVANGGYLAPDERGVHASVGDSIQLEGNVADFYGLFMPTAAPALATLTSRSVVHQERELGSWVLPVDDAGLPAFYAALDSRTARQRAELGACQNIPFVIEQGNDPSGWIAALTPILRNPAIALFDVGHGVCGATLGTTVFGAEITAMVDAITAANAERFLYLLGFDYGPEASFDVISKAVLGAPSLLIRDRALSRLATQARNSFGTYSALPSTELPRWRSFFHARLVEAVSTTRFLAAWSGAIGLDDDAALVVAGGALHALPLFASQQRQVVCDAYRLAQKVRPAAWDEFVAAVQPTSTLAASAAAAVANPALCDAQLGFARAAGQTWPITAARRCRSPDCP